MSQYLELEGAITTIKHQHGRSTMTPDYGNFLTDRATLQRSRNTRIKNLPSSNERRGIDWSSRDGGGCSESPRRSSYPLFSPLDTPEWIRREKKDKFCHEMTKASLKMIDPSVLQAEKNKAYVIQERLAMGNVAYVGTVVNLMPMIPDSQDILDACMMQTSFKLKGK
jgi:hypothetical protein